jgi:(E)-4-hydroxy-3-methylbut-2-enyl-diphosphate synthase
VRIGDVPLGGMHPIRVQSMTTTNTMDTEGTIAQCLRMAASGSEYIRITAPSINEAKNLAEIRKGLHAKGCKVPLIADIHFTPNAAEVAARIVEKVRVNPGNYADKKKFDVIDYTDAEYQAELDRIHNRFAPLVKICKEHGTAMRIGTNHGSLSDRIMSRYGDSPLGMVESAIEFLDICEMYNYDQVVLSMKASNTQVMVQAYRLLVSRMMERGKLYPLHLGVTEAGEGEDGRVKSAQGIATLLMDGIGDTVRVSLTEEPEYENPVARFIINQWEMPDAASPSSLTPVPSSGINPYAFNRRESAHLLNLGQAEVPRVVADYSHTALQRSHLIECGYTYSELLDKYNLSEMSADYLYTGSQPVPFDLPGALKQVVDAASWRLLRHRDAIYPFFSSLQEYINAPEVNATLNFVSLAAHDFDTLRQMPIDLTQKATWVLTGEGRGASHAWRWMINALDEFGDRQPVILRTTLPEGYPFYEDGGIPAQYRLGREAQDQLWLSALTGTLLVDGRVDGLWITHSTTVTHRTAFGVLQAGRLRISKTEYISCPSCGRTLFDLQETTAKIRARTEHLKGVKIGIMGCIVNGPGEMADADYGYVGVGPDKIALYRGKEVVEKAVKTDLAVDKLIDLIRADGKWIELE